MAEVLFKKVDYTVKKLIEDIDQGEIGLPDIQRPFVWKTTKVRDLFDSMYRGYPIGFLLFWENGFPGEHRVIGVDKKQKVPRLLIVDGQQRLTSLYAIMKGKPILTKDYKEKRLKIAFHPLREIFEVTNSAIQKNPEWISDISTYFADSARSYSLIHSFLEQLRKTRSVSQEEEDRIAQSIERLIKLLDYPLTALEISLSVPEEQVAEIFVRVNSQGQELNQADFILTLMSVFWEEGRRELENFCRDAKKPPTEGKPSPFNYYFLPDPSHLLRAAVALGFRRAALEHVYSLLRGKDLKTREFSEEQRDRQFAILKRVQSYTLDLQNWHEFFKVLRRAGYPGGQIINSQTAILYTYALWLIGKRDFHVDPYRLREVMARWFFMATLTGRYTSAAESQMEEDLAMLRGIQSPEEFIQTLDQQIDIIFTKDYWEVTLPNELESAAARNTAQFAYFASLCLLDAKVLYSQMKVVDLLDPSTKARRSPVERHHLFPRKYLIRLGIKENRLINQVANYALVEWSDNLRISDQPPKEYVPPLERRFTEEELKQMYFWHALPERWYEMEYTEFLKQRRKRIARVIREGFMRLKQPSEVRSHLGWRRWF